MGFKRFKTERADLLVLVCSLAGDVSKVIPAITVTFATVKHYSYFGESQVFMCVFFSLILSAWQRPAAIHKSSSETASILQTFAHALHTAAHLL